RRIPNSVLARELIRNLAIDSSKLARRGREKDASARFLRELAQDELRLLEAFIAGDAQLVRSEANRIDRGLGSFRKVQHFFEWQQARRVLTVREHDDRLTADLVDVACDDLFEILQRNVDRVVHRGRSAR